MSFLAFQLGKEGWVIRRFIVLLFLLMLAGCNDGPTEEKETGYKGKARIDAYLAATRLLQRYGWDVADRPGWQKPGPEDAVVIVPISVLNAKGFLRELDPWIRRGGHLVCLGERADSWHNDWADTYHADEKLIPEPCKEWLAEHGFTFEFRSSAPTFDTRNIVADDAAHDVFVDSSYAVSRKSGDAHLFESSSYGDGRISILMDARPFRNRFIDEHENSSLLLSVVGWTGADGRILIIRDASLSFWKLLWSHGWPALTGLLVLIIFWLWRNMPGFGPKLAPDERSTLRAYDHHLEALGDFHWRLDKAAGLLRPLRDSILERAQQRASAAGHFNGDLFAWIGERTGLPSDRVQRAMTQETPGDGSLFARLLADLQTIHLSLS